MSFVKYLLLFVVLGAAHLVLSATPLIVFWFLLGIGLYPFFKKVRYFLLRILLVEVVLAVSLWMLVWNRNEALDRLAGNSSYPSFAWIGVPVLVNVLTAALCISVPFYCIRIFKRKQKKQRDVSHALPAHAAA